MLQLTPCRFCKTGDKISVTAENYIDLSTLEIKYKVKITCQGCSQEFGAETDNPDNIIAAWNWANKPRKENNKNIMEHDWQKDEDGNIDEWAFEDADSIHHGPICKKCGYSFCVQCDPEGWNAQPCEQE